MARGLEFAGKSAREQRTANRENLEMCRGSLLVSSRVLISVWVWGNHQRPGKESLRRIKRNSTQSCHNTVKSALSSGRLKTFIIHRALGRLLSGEQLAPE